MSQRNQHLSFKYTWNLICQLREIIFVTNVAVLTIETIKLVFKPLDIFWRFWNTRKRYVCVKGNIEGRERGCQQSLLWGTKNFWQRRWKTYTRFLTTTQKHLVLSTRPKTLEPWRTDFKFEEGYTHEKSNCPVSKYFHAFVSTLNYVSPIGAVTKEDEVVMRDRIDNFWPVWIDSEL